MKKKKHEIQKHKMTPKTCLKKCQNIFKNKKIAFLKQNTKLNSPKIKEKHTRGNYNHNCHKKLLIL